MSCALRVDVLHSARRIERGAQGKALAIGNQRRALLGGQRDRRAIVDYRDINQPGKLLDEVVALVEKAAVTLRRAAELAQLGY